MQQRTAASPAGWLLSCEDGAVLPVSRTLFCEPGAACTVSLLEDHEPVPVLPVDRHVRDGQQQVHATAWQALHVHCFLKLHEGRRHAGSQAAQLSCGPSGAI